MMNSGGGGWVIAAWVAMGLMILLFWGGLATVVVILVRRTNVDEGTNPARPSHHDAERILQERFARGEIDEDEFTARRTALRHSE